MSRCLFFSIAAMILLLPLAPAQFGFGVPARQEHVKTKLVAETEAVQPGTPFTLGVHFTLDPKWHIYWQTPGPAAGLPTAVTWELPEGFTASELQWPAPIRFVTPAGDEDLISYGYYDEVVLMATITPTVDLAPGSEIEITARVSWLACMEICIPGRATPAITLPVVDATPAPSEHQQLLAEMRARVPVKLEAATATTARGTNDVTLHVELPDGVAPDDLGEVTFFPEAEEVFDAQSGFTLLRTAERISIVMPLLADGEPVPEQLRGVLAAEHGWGETGPSALKIDVPLGAVLVGETLAAPVNELAAPATAGRILINMLFAFIGGLLLNLMPCVLPVLSIKVMDFVKQANDESGRAWRHGLAFLAGVLISFWAIAAVSIGLKLAGTSMGWAFQFQYPAFNFILVAVLFIFALSMFGVFEVGLSMTTVGGDVTRKTGLTGSFFSGLLATVVATPCIAPFMGPAIAFGMAQPAFVTLIIFTMLGLGMALPYVLLSAYPRLLKYVPKPGAWMETFKQALGFLLIGAVLWLLWVLAWQVNPDGLIAVLMALVAFGVAAWVLGKWAMPVRSGRCRNIARLAALLLLVGGIWYGISSLGKAEAAVGTTVIEESGGIAWVPFDRQAIPELREQGQAVFVDFTAKWCITCQTNERVALTRNVGTRMKELDIVPMKADWTRRDETIAAALAEHGRNGVPLYVLYPADPAKAPIILPQLLTEGMVINALNALDTQ